MTIGNYMKPRVYAEPGTNFEGIPFKVRPPQATSHCPLCKGHGSYNHHMNAYVTLPRHIYGLHSVHTCRECNGSGWVWELHEHVWKFSGNIGNCLNRWKCEVCGKLTDVNSGD